MRIWSNGLKTNADMTGSVRRVFTVFVDWIFSAYFLRFVSLTVLERVRLHLIPAPMTGIPGRLKLFFSVLPGRLKLFFNVLPGRTTSASTKHRVRQAANRTRSWSRANAPQWRTTVLTSSRKRFHPSWKPRKWSMCPPTSPSRTRLSSGQTSSVTGGRPRPECIDQSVTFLRPDSQCRAKRRRRSTSRSGRFVYCLSSLWVLGERGECVSQTSERRMGHVLEPIVEWWTSEKKIAFMKECRASGILI